jgi:integrative and conjugative element protein (TIGR02256 family)
MWETLYTGVTLEENPLSCIIFARDIINKFKKFNRLRKESGGLLLGYIRGFHFDVRYITTPCLEDISTPSSFERKDPFHLKKLNSLYKKSFGKIVYIGEWHTHQEDYPKPSLTDIREWHNIKSEKQYFIIFLIIGKKGFYIEKF